MTFGLFLATAFSALLRPVPLAPRSSQCLPSLFLVPMRESQVKKQVSQLLVPAALRGAGPGVRSGPAVGGATLQWFASSSWPRSIEMSTGAAGGEALPDLEEASIASQSACRSRTRAATEARTVTRLLLAPRREARVRWGCRGRSPRRRSLRLSARPDRNALKAIEPLLWTALTVMGEAPGRFAPSIEALACAARSAAQKTTRFTKPPLCRTLAIAQAAGDPDAEGW